MNYTRNGSMLDPYLKVNFLSIPTYIQEISKEIKFYSFIRKSQVT